MINYIQMKKYIYIQIYLNKSPATIAITVRYSLFKTIEILFFDNGERFSFVSCFVSKDPNSNFVYKSKNKKLLDGYTFRALLGNAPTLPGSGRFDF